MSAALHPETVAWLRSAEITARVRECYDLGRPGPIPRDMPPDDATRYRLLRGCGRWAAERMLPDTLGPSEWSADELEDEVQIILAAAQYALHGVEYSPHDARLAAARVLGAARVRAETERIAQPAKSRLRVEHVADVLRRVREEHDSGGVPTLSTPIPALDEFLGGGIAPGELVYLAARPGVGKTALALEFARHFAAHGRRVLVVSREMLASALARRMLAQSARIRATDLKRGTVAAAELAAGIGQLAQMPIWLCDTASTLDHVAAACEQVPDGVELLIVDYLQLVQAPSGVGEARHRVEYVSAGTKQLAMRLQVPVLMLSSLSRAADTQRPTMAALRESGQLEHDADTVLFLHRDSPTSNVVELIVAKARDGEQGIVPLAFAGEYVSFLGAATPQHWPVDPDGPEESW